MARVDERGSDSGVSAAGAGRFVAVGAGQSTAVGGGQYTAPGWVRDENGRLRREANGEVYEVAGDGRRACCGE